MRLAISNIAWDVAEDERIANLLQALGVDAIDIAPGKYFPDPPNASLCRIDFVRRWWSDRKIEITGMQALLFGTQGLNLFGASDSRDRMLAHLGSICRIAGGLGATRLVFGSPKNRDRSGLDDQTTATMAIDFFSRLGDLALAAGVTICLEPNPTVYGANFMTNSRETADIVKQTGHPAIRMQLDTGALAINEEDPEAVIEHYADLIGHIHASEPDLVPVGSSGTVDHVRIGRALARRIPDRIVSIEMLPGRTGSGEDAIHDAISTCNACYRETCRQREA